MMSELTELYGEPIKEIRGAKTDVVTIIVGDEEPYESIRISGDRLTVERGPNFGEQISLQRISEDLEISTANIVEQAIGELESSGAFPTGVPVGRIVDEVIDQHGVTEDDVAEGIEELRKRGDIYEPTAHHFRVV